MVKSEFFFNDSFYCFLSVVFFFHILKFLKNKTFKKEFINSQLMLVSNFIFLPTISDLKIFMFFPESVLIVSLFIFFIVVLLVSYSKNYKNVVIQNSLIYLCILVLCISSYTIFNDFVIFFNFILLILGTNDAVALLTKIILLISSAFYFILISRFLKFQKLKVFEYIVIIFLAILGLFILTATGDLLTAYLTIELSSLSLYTLASFKKTSSYSADSGLKYFIVGSVSSVIFLFGSSIVYVSTGTVNFLDLVDLFSSLRFDVLFPVSEAINLHVEDYVLVIRDIFAATLPSQNPTKLMIDMVVRILKGESALNSSEMLLGLFYTKTVMFTQIGLSFLLFSLFIKLALAPFHLWSLDVYEGSPTPSTFFFAVITKLSIFVLLIHLCYTGFINLIRCWQFYCVALGIFSVFVGSVAGLRQRNLKTLLAYSSVSHMGYALIAFSIGTFEGIQTLLYYLIIYIISGLCIWSVLLLLVLKRKNYATKFSKELADLVLLNQTNTGLAFVLAVTMFSIAGIPPMIGFIAKLSVFLSILGGFMYFTGLVNSLFSVISTFYYIRIIKIIYFENVLVGRLYYYIDTKKSLVVSFLGLSLVFLFFSPSLSHLIAIDPFYTAV